MSKKDIQRQIKIQEIENEFYRIADIIRNQGDIDCLLDLIPIETKIKFIENWKVVE